MTETCWVCGAAIDPGDAQVAAHGVPRRLSAFEGRAVHLRCHGEWAGAAPPPTTRKTERSAQPLTAGKRLFAEDIATIRGISPRQARRWLRRLEERYGCVVVGRTDGRRGPRRFTTTAALEAIGPRVAVCDAALHEHLRELEERISRLEAQSSAPRPL